MIIQKIKSTNFKSIYDDFELDFKDIRGLWKIAGEVGSGKTTIGEIVIFGLFGSINGKNNADLISWGRKHSKVELWCQSRNHNIYICRENNTYGQSPVKIYVDDEELLYTNKRDAQQKLEDEYFDISRITMELLCIISFNNFKSLATLNTKDTKIFLDRVLGFKIISDYEDKCKEFRNNQYSLVVNIKSDIDKLEAQIHKIEDLSRVEVIDGNVDELRREVNNIKKDIDNLTSEYNNNTRKKMDDLSALKMQLNTITTLGKKKKEDLSFIKKGVCPTCGAKIDQSGIPTLNNELAELKASYVTIKEVSDKLIKELDTLKNEFYDKLNKLNTLSTEKTKYIYRLDEQKRRLNINYEEIDALKKEVNTLNIKLSNYEKEWNEWGNLYDILYGNVRNNILDAFIPSFNNHISLFSQKLKLPYIIRFDKDFKCHVKLYGQDIDISLSSLSTGQLKTVDTVIIFGMLNMLLGISTSNIIFLDELFSNMDINLRFDMCKMLADTLKNDQIIFIISHSDMDDMFFNGKINLCLIKGGNYERYSTINIEKS